MLLMNRGAAFVAGAWLLVASQAAAQSRPARARRTSPLCEAPGGANELDFHPGCPVPPGYRRVLSVRTPVVSAGTVVFSISYLFVAFVGYMQPHQQDSGWLYAPLVGPLVYASKHGQHQREFQDYLQDSYVIDSSIQLVGATMIVAGLLSRRELLVRNEPTYSRPRWSVMPAALSGRGIGISLSAFNF
jgi:hypothetical protein